MSPKQPSPKNALLPAELLTVWSRMAPRRSCTWEAVKQMLGGAAEDSKRVESQICDLLNRSDAALSPMSDPLRAGLGLNRWLRSDREEAYSDWLAWIFEQLGSRDVVALLPIDDPEIADHCVRTTLRIDREYVIPDGRLDLVLRFGQQAVLVVEVKLSSAESAQTAKQKHYGEWLKEHLARYKIRPVLLVVEAADTDYEGFQPFRWAELCFGLRRMLPDLSHRIGLVKAAMVAAFIGAVEENLLLLAIPPGTGPGSTLFFHKTVGHLERGLQRAERKI